MSPHWTTGNSIIDVPTSHSMISLKFYSLIPHGYICLFYLHNIFFFLTSMMLDNPKEEWNESLVSDLLLKHINSRSIDAVSHYVNSVYAKIKQQ